MERQWAMGRLIEEEAEMNGLQIEKKQTVKQQTEECLIEGKEEQWT